MSPDPAPGRSQAGSTPLGGSATGVAVAHGEAIQMHVRLHLPTSVLHEGVAAHVFAVAEDGAFGLLPNHADYVASLVPSVLVLRGVAGDELFFGIDQGLLVKHGYSVDIAVRRGVRGSSLETLAETVAAIFSQVDEAEREARTALSRLEVGMVRQLSELRKPG